MSQNIASPKYTLSINNIGVQAALAANKSSLGNNSDIPNIKISTDTSVDKTHDSMSIHDGSIHKHHANKHKKKSKFSFFKKNTTKNKAIIQHNQNEAYFDKPSFSGINMQHGTGHSTPPSPKDKSEDVLENEIRRNDYVEFMKEANASFVDLTPVQPEKIYSENILNISNMMIILLTCVAAIIMTILFIISKISINNFESILVIQIISLLLYLSYIIWSKFSQKLEDQ